MGYQECDQHIVDYQMYELAGVAPHPGSGRFRGPPVAGSRYIACVGAAQTFGRFCTEPFPVLLRRELGIETMNLGHPGAGPTFHNSNPRLLRHINDAEVVIVQVMSARSQSNSLFGTWSHSRDGIRQSDGVLMTAERFYYELVLQEPDRVAAIVEETREHYVQDMLRLLGDITPPTILFWFSVRRPDYTAAYQLPLDRLFGSFPHLVNRAMIARLRVAADRYVECVTARGLPQPLFDRQGRPTIVTQQDDHGSLEDYGSSTVSYDRNPYYPSPDMHADAAVALTEACRDLVGDNTFHPRPPSAPTRADDIPKR
jgi:Domain of unknown function (DUF6473)